MDSIGELIKRYRELNNVSQISLGVELGYSRGDIISHFESGRREIPIGKLKPCCNFLNIPKEEMIQAFVNEKLKELEKFFE